MSVMGGVLAEIELGAGAAARGISNVRVEDQRSEDGAGRIILTWLDRAGAEQRETYNGIFAEEFRTDLHVATMLGEHSRQTYLIGRIRELRRLRRD